MKRAVRASSTVGKRVAMKRTNLVMFDVDDTLVKGNGVDSVCYCKAIEEVLGIVGIDTNWSRYSNVTDSGITSEIVQTTLSRKAEHSDITAVRRSYLARLSCEIAKNPHSFKAIPGAPCAKDARST